MSHYSDRVRQNEIGAKLDELRTLAYKRDGDGRPAVTVTCDACRSCFEEDLLVAENKTMLEEQILCLDCDPDAEKSSGITGIVIRIGIVW